MRTFFVVVLAKLLRHVLRLCGRGGTTLPGRVALALDPKILMTLADPVGSVVVTGTNGKTTTASILRHALEMEKFPVIANSSGANLLPGIATEFIAYKRFWDRGFFVQAVIECDEEALAEVCAHLNPMIIVVTNVFSDHLDRFGSVSQALEHIRQGLNTTPDAFLCLNADDALSVSLLDGLDRPTNVHRLFFYGMEDMQADSVADKEPTLFCSRCQESLSFHWHTYAHLGGWFCANCGHSRPRPSVAASEVTPTARGSEITLRIEKKVFRCSFNIPGSYNVYNALAAATVLRCQEVDARYIAEAVVMSKAGFGRMESFEIQGIPLTLTLAKNPAGFNQVLQYLVSLQGEVQLALVLNDNDADGNDISWIWEVDFEALLSASWWRGASDAGDGAGDGALGSRILVSGKRSWDLALRLKYAGFAASAVTFVESELLLEQVLQQELPVYIVPNYSALLPLRETLTKRYGVPRAY